MTRQLEPLHFHEQLRLALRELEPGLWRWFSSDKFGKSYADSVRLELLRSTYRLPREEQAHLYGLASEVAGAFQLDAPVTLYQSQEGGDLNAGLLFVPGEIHVVLRGPVTKTLSEAELRALFGHELAHYDLWTREGGEHRIAGALIEHIAASRGAAPSHVQTALRARRWTEIYADRGALIASDDLAAAVGCLVKMSTGLTTVSADAYVTQAEEAIGGVADPTGTTHPEPFVRAFALKMWSSGADEHLKLRQLVEGRSEIDSLDLVQQRELSETTRRLLHVILEPTWMRTEATQIHARRFFPEESFGSATADADIALDGALAEYVAYVLLDFGMVDAEIEEVSLAWVAHLGRTLGVRDALQKVARKELRLSAASYTELERRGTELTKKPPAEGAIAP